MSKLYECDFCSDRDRSNSALTVPIGWLLIRVTATGTGRRVPNITYDVCEKCCKEKFGEVTPTAETMDSMIRDLIQGEVQDAMEGGP